MAQTSVKPTESQKLNAKTHAVFWLGALAGLLLVIWLFKGILMPFVLGIAIAYLLNPLVEYLGRAGVPRVPATLLILAAFVCVFLAILLTALPVLYREIMDLAERAPEIGRILWSWAEPHVIWAQSKLGHGDIEDLRTLVQNNISNAFQIGTNVVSRIASGGLILANFLTLLVLTPIVAYFMMKEYPRMVQWMDDLMPRHSAETIRDLLRQINTKVAGFVRGQLMVVSVLALFYALALSIAGLNFGFLIGITAGLLSIIPMVGSTLGLVISVAVAWFQTGEWTFVAIVAGIFLFGQIVEGNVLAPKLLGESVGLHPLWVIFALMAGGSLFGVLGMFLAVPIAAAIGVILSFAVVQYKKSPYYKGRGDDSAGSQPGNSS